MLSHTGFFQNLFLIIEGVPACGVKWRCCERLTEWGGVDFHSHLGSLSSHLLPLVPSLSRAGLPSYVVTSLQAHVLHDLGSGSGLEMSVFGIDATSSGGGWGGRCGVLLGRLGV